MGGAAIGAIYEYVVDQLGELPAPPSPNQTFQTNTITTVGAIDPNDKLAPAGFSDDAFLQADTPLAYQIRFENKSEATAPARRVFITDTLDDDLDLSTFELTEIAFGDFTFSIPPGLNRYQTSFMADADGTEILIEVDAGVDQDTRELTLSLQAIDPSTGWTPEDPLTGLLYPNDESRRGEGSISYIVHAKEGLASGTQIHNRASIIFDYNEPILTPQVLNTLDAGVPSSLVAPLPAIQSSSEFEVSWTGADDANGSGIATYDIYMSTNDEPFVPLLLDTTETSATIVPLTGRTYSFYSVARDNVGHVQPLSTTNIVSTFVELQSLGDLNGDGQLDSADIDDLYVAIQSETHPAAFDLTADGLVDDNDVTELLSTYLFTTFGDADLDRAVDFSDFLVLADNFGQEGDWSRGDSNGDGLVNFADFLQLANNFGFRYQASSDFNKDSFVNGRDIDLLFAAIAAGSQSLRFDLYDDGVVDAVDLDELVEVILESRLGDTNLDTRVNFSDFLILSRNFGEEGGWSNGDSNGDGIVDFKDFLILSGNFGFRNDP